jgi:Domain of unknown function (DUF397)
VTGQSTGKPTVAELGIDPAAQVWRRSGNGDGALEVAFARAADADPAGPAHRGDPADPAGPAGPAHRADPPHRTTHRAEWVLMRVAGDPEQRVLVFDRHEWECFLDGARKGEFDDAAAG